MCRQALLKALAEKQIPGISLNQRILLLGQTRELTVEEAVGGLRVEEETVLEHVIRSNAERERYTKEATCQFLVLLLRFRRNMANWGVVLSKALDGQDDDST